jgi:uncharacterized membrane protein YidH (DUF202 family)
MNRSLGIVLLVVGVLMMVFTGFKYVTNEKVIDLGPIEINADKKHSVEWPPMVGLVLIVGGIVVLVRGKK